MQDDSDNIVMFYPHVSKLAKKAVMEVLDTRWIGQGPKVKLFEESFSNKFASKLPAIAVGSGTDALHLSYILAGLKPGDEVIAPVFTCTATNIPFLYMGIKILFADIDPNTMNIDVNHVNQLINKNVKAIICVHYGGLPCDMDEIIRIAGKYNLTVIEDAAHAVGAEYKHQKIGNIGHITAFSFYATKNMTTIEGGMIWPSVPEAAIVPVARGASYLARIMTGKEIRPMAMTVAPTIPVVAAKRAPTKTTAIPSPPGTGPNNCAIVIKRSSATFERWSISPMKINMGNATSTQLFITSQILSTTREL